MKWLMILMLCILTGCVRGTVKPDGSLSFISFLKTAKGLTIEAENFSLSVNSTTSEARAMSDSLSSIEQMVNGRRASFDPPPPNDEP